MYRLKRLHPYHALIYKSTIVVARCFQMATADGAWLVFTKNYQLLQEIGRQPSVEDALKAYEKYRSGTRKKSKTRHKEEKYTVASAQITQGKIRKLSDLFPLLPKSLASDLGVTSQRLSLLSQNPGKWTIDQLIRLASLLKTNETTLLDLAHEDYRRIKQKKPS